MRITVSPQNEILVLEWYFLILQAQLYKFGIKFLNNLDILGKGLINIKTLDTN